MKPEDLLVQRERKLTETPSETSECTTTTTSVSGYQGFENREELLQLAALLQIEDPDDVYRQRFRVDRRKLEHMLLGEQEATETAEIFFRKIMDETNTYISWPTRLKVGAKSKKDPHIKVAGRISDVSTAKEKIMQVLDTRSVRVTMKLDVSYTDHSHIIGKGGLTIKRVMEETGCHIHFPDSNRSNHQEKSNQVSIAGEMENAERARACVRNLTPLIFAFELPIMGAMQSPPDPTSTHIIKVQEEYNVQVMFRTRPKLHATLVVVKGCEWEVQRVKEATNFLIHYMCRNLASQIQVHMSMEISPQHHSLVLGKQSNNLRQIMQRTSTQIMFPDAGDPNIPSLKKSSVTIIGSIDNVYLARQQIVGSLPLVLMFDIPENLMERVDTDCISRMMQNHDVFINVRHKPKQNTLSVIIKGVERNATSIYEVRRQLLKLDDESKIIANIPPTYLSQNSGPMLQGLSVPSSPGNFSNLSDNFSNNFFSRTPSPSQYSLSPLPLTPNSLSLSPPWNVPQVPSIFPPIGNSYALNNHQNAALLAATCAAIQSNILSQHRQQQQQQQQQQHHHHHHQQAMNLSTQNLLGLSHPPGFHQNPRHNIHNLNSNNNSIASSKTNSLSDNKDSNYFSISSASSTMSSPALSPRNISPICTSDRTSGIGGLSSVFGDLSIDRMINDNSQSFDLLSQRNDTSLPSDYEIKKMEALQALKNKPKPNEFRVPTPVWSGFGLSQTMPAAVSSTSDLTPPQKLSTSSTGDTSDIWDDPKTPLVYMGQVLDFDNGKTESIGMTSTYLDHTPTSKLNKILSGTHDDLPTTLTSIGLEKYIRTFSSHEIDMATFTTLTDKDLTEIGITAWGARRKMLLLIAEMNKRNKPFSGSAAPGAERKSSLTGTSTSGTNCSNVEGGTW